MTTHKEPRANKPKAESKKDLIDKTKQERKPLFEHPADWREQIKATFTLQTTIPVSQEKFLQDNKPDFQGVKTQQQRLMSKKTELIQKIKNIDQEISKITDEKKFRIDQLKDLIKNL